MAKVIKFFVLPKNLRVFFGIIYFRRVNNRKLEYHFFCYFLSAATESNQRTPLPPKEMEQKYLYFQFFTTVFDLLQQVTMYVPTGRFSTEIATFDGFIVLNEMFVILCPKIS